MKKNIKKFGKCLIIYIVIFVTLLTTVSYGYTQEEVGETIASYASGIANNYADVIEYSMSYLRTNNPIWSSSRSWDDGETSYFDCSSFASGCYYEVTGLLSSAPATSSLAGISDGGDYEKSTVSSTSDLMTGDLVFWNGSGDLGHALIYVGNNKFCEVGGSSGNIGYRTADSYISYCQTKGRTLYYIRVSEEFAESLTDLDVDTSGTVTVKSEDYEEGDFYFNGIPDGKYSIASGLNLKIVVNTLASIADYIIGILTYIVRVVIVGWTSIIDRLFSWTVNSMFGVSEDLGITGTEVDDQDSSTRITIESIFYGEYDLLDINIFE